jgi:phosphatidylglycerol:prolipoprotein diacylglycerol transferase
MFSLYLIGYGVARFIIEYVREPDAQLGFILSNLTMGQLLCAGMVLSSIYLFFFSKKHNTRRYQNENWQKY